MAAEQSEFRIAGKCLHTAKVEGRGVALAYSELTKEEVTLVEQHIRMATKVQAPRHKVLRRLMSLEK